MVCQRTDSVHCSKSAEYIANQTWYGECISIGSRKTNAAKAARKKKMKTSELVKRYAGIDGIILTFGDYPVCLIVENNKRFIYFSASLGELEFVGFIEPEEIGMYIAGFDPAGVVVLG